MRAPFSGRSKPWELDALALRRLAVVGVGERLDPWRLAPEVGLRVVDLADVLPKLSADERRHLLRVAHRMWSGGVYPRLLPDGSRVCLLNPSDSYRRRKITLMEEICHVYLKHAPSALAITEDGVQVREYLQVQEAQAYGVGAAALVPWGTLFTALNRGAAVEELADAFDVTPELITYRIKITGAYRLYTARQCREA